MSFQGSGFLVRGSGFKVQGAVFRVQGHIAREQRRAPHPSATIIGDLIVVALVIVALRSYCGYYCYSAPDPSSAPTSIKFNRFLKLILLEHKPLLACFGFVTRQKWLVSRKVNLTKRLNLT